MTTEGIPFTKQGYEALKDELERLKKDERPKVISEIAEARAHGDLKENAEYHAAREKQSFIEGRITILDDSLARAKVIDFHGQGVETVQFGAWVGVEDVESGEEKRYRIVGDLEADIQKNLISVKSPIARALLGKEEGDEVNVRAPKGDVTYVISVINYDDAP